MNDIGKRVEFVLVQVFSVITEKNLAITHLSQDEVEGWNSMEHLNLLLSLEEEFSVNIPDEDAIALTSYPAICDCIAKLLSK